MGITDVPKQVNLTDVYPEGTPFLCTSAWVEGVVKTQYGDRTMAKILAEDYKPGEESGGQGREFAVWGSLCEQVQQLDDGELPMVLAVVKDGKRWLFTPYEQSADEAMPVNSDGEKQEVAS